MAKIYCVVLLCLTSCINSAPISYGEPGETHDISWPAPPETARIKFISMFSNGEELRFKKSLGQRMRSFLTGVEDSAMTRPYAVTANSLLVVVADPGSATVHVFNKSKRTFKQIHGAGGYRFSSPIGVVLGENKLFVTDSKLNKVFILNNEFDLISAIENLQRPTGIAFDENSGQLFIASTLSHQIYVYDSNGRHLFKIGERGTNDLQFNYPSHLTFSGSHLYVNDTMNFRIQVLTADGQHVRSFGKHGIGSGHFTQSKGIAVDSDGHIYVADAVSSRIQIFDQSGTYLLGFGNNNDGPGSFDMPTGLAIWSDQIYVTDSLNQRIQVFKYIKK